jgi:hypothetical protein
MADYIELENTSDDVKKLVKQELKFKTGNFVWRVSFSAPLNPATVNTMNMYVTNSKLEPLKTRINYDSAHGYIEIEPLEPYAQHETYILTITKNVESKGGQKLKKEIKVSFKL